MIDTTMRSPAAVITTEGDPLNWETVAYQLAGALSAVMLPSDSVMPSDEITRVIEAFTVCPTKEPLTNRTLLAVLKV